jgi:hypothetical protein
MSEVGFLGVSSSPIVLLVRKAILMSVFLKMLVIWKVSLPTYVNFTHLWGVSLFFGWACLGVWALCGRIGNPLFCRMLWIEFSSSCYSSCCRL